jgi:hypothetical protein
MSHFAHLPVAHPLAQLRELARIKAWLRTHRHEQPVEYQTMDAVLTLWVLGWVGALPALVLGAWWLLPLCAMCARTPHAYVRARLRWHALGRLRCDWASLANPSKPLHINSQTHH